MLKGLLESLAANPCMAGYTDYRLGECSKIYHAYNIDDVNDILKTYVVAPMCINRSRIHCIVGVAPHGEEPSFQESSVSRFDMSRTKAFLALCGLATIHSAMATGFKAFERLDTTGFEIIADGENKNCDINLAPVAISRG